MTAFKSQKNCWIERNTTSIIANMYGYETFELTARHIDQTFRMHVALPLTYAQADQDQFRLVYVLDADLAFGLAASTMMLTAGDLIDPGVAPAVIVGIGYDQPQDMNILRVRDLTPEGSVDDWFAESYKQLAGRPAESGGAAAFLEFIESELHPEVTRRFRVEECTAAIMGDSYGGLFTYFTFLKQSPLFDRYWMGSPGVTGCGRYLLDELSPLLAQGLDRPTRVFLSLGERERKGSVGDALPVEIYREIASAYDRLYTSFTDSSVPDLQFAAMEFPQETHTSVIPAAFCRAYRFLLAQ